MVLLTRKYEYPDTGSILASARRLDYEVSDPTDSRIPRGWSAISPGDLQVVGCVACSTIVFQSATYDVMGALTTQSRHLHTSRTCLVLELREAASGELIAMNTFYGPEPAPLPKRIHGFLSGHEEFREYVGGPVPDSAVADWILGTLSRRQLGLRERR
jgi:hypothetical protein